MSGVYLLVSPAATLGEKRRTRPITCRGQKRARSHSFQTGAWPRSVVTVDEEIALLTSAAKPCVKVSLHTAPQCYASCHEYPAGLVVCSFTPSHLAMLTHT